MAMAKDEAFLQDAAKMRADIVVNDGDEIAALYAGPMRRRGRWSSAPSRNSERAGGQ